MILSSNDDISLISSILSRLFFPHFSSTDIPTKMTTLNFPFFLFSGSSPYRSNPYPIKTIKMLKWTVQTTKRPETVSDPLDPTSSSSSSGVIRSRRSIGTITSSRSRTPHRLNGRRSLGSCRKTLIVNPDKENHCTSTPYPSAPPSQQASTNVSPFVKFESIALRDVSNLTPSSPTVMTTPQNRKRTYQTTPQCSTMRRNHQNPPQYASTLPSFDIEYSPCDLNSVPFFALRGLGIADSYYENPRYFNDVAPPIKRSRPQQTTEKPATPQLSDRMNDLRFSRKSFKRSSFRNINNNNIPKDESLSSSMLGDTALDKMIDAILESAKKDQRTNQTTKLPSIFKDKSPKRMLEEVFSPSYTPAEDPASDLNKFDDHLLLSPSKYLEAADRTIILDETTTVYNEREVKTPDSNAATKSPSSTRRSPQKDDDPGTPLLEQCCLKRRKAVRRKLHHKIDNDERIGLTIPNGIPDSPSTIEKNSRLIGLTLPNGIPSPDTPAAANGIHKNFSCLRKSFDELAQMATPIKEIAIIVDSDQGRETTPEIQATDLQGSSTPTTGEISSMASGGIRRCLTFSPDVSEESLEKRRSVASSTTSRSLKMGYALGSLDLAMFATDENKLNVHGEWYGLIQRNLFEFKNKSKK